MSDNPVTPAADAPPKAIENKPQIPEKTFKTEKIEKFEKLEHKEKPEKLEHKEKPEKHEHKEKPEKHEHKEKPEKLEHKEKPEKLEFVEKQIGKEKDGKEIAEVPGGDPGDPIAQRLAALEQGLASVQHFITTGQRPDLSRGALAAEPDKKKP